MFLSQRTNLLFAIAFFGTKRFKEEDIKNDKNGNLPLLDVKIDDQNFILLNIYFELLLETKGENSFFKKISCDDD